jgi:hypothetical protein
VALWGYLFNYTTSKNEQQSTQLRDKTERDIALDNQREAVLEVYLDKMSELLLFNRLRESAEGEEARKIARVRTLKVLGRLDAERKGSVLRLLYESGLIDIDSGANVATEQLDQAQSLKGAIMPSGSKHPCGLHS